MSRPKNYGGQRLDPCFQVSDFERGEVVMQTNDLGDAMRKVGQIIASGRRATVCLNTVVFDSAFDKHIEAAQFLASHSATGEGV